MCICVSVVSMLEHQVSDSVSLKCEYHTGSVFSDT